MTHQLALLGTDENRNSIDQYHGAKLQFEIPFSEDLALDEIEQALVSLEIPIVCSWPKRAMSPGQWLPNQKHRSAVIGDIYTKLAPKEIGVFKVDTLVKVNKSWVLHGRIHYRGGHGVNHRILTPFKLVVQSYDRVRGDRDSGQVLHRITKLITGPNEAS